MTQMMKIAFAILMLGGITAWGQAQKDVSGTPPKPPGSAQKIDRAEAYYHFVLAHMYADEAAFGGNQESAKKAAEHFQAAVKADPNMPVTNAELQGTYTPRTGRPLQILAPHPATPQPKTAPEPKSAPQPNSK
jgi:hypothetical protein